MYFDQNFDLFFPYLTSISNYFFISKNLKLNKAANKTKPLKIIIISNLIGDWSSFSASMVDWIFDSVSVSDWETKGNWSIDGETLMSFISSLKGVGIVPVGKEREGRLIRVEENEEDEKETDEDEVGRKEDAEEGADEVDREGL
jgi:hypothetical protein